MRINFRDALFSEKPDFDFVIRGLKSGTIGFLSGAGSAGKGFLTMAIAIAVADTTEKANFLDLVPQNRGRVGYISAEDDAEVLRAKMHDVGQFLLSKIGFDENTIDAIEENLSVFSLFGKNMRIYDPNDKEGAKKWIESLKSFSEDKRLVILDTLTRIHRGNENSQGDMTAVLATLEEIAQKTGTTFLITHHVRKASISEDSAEQDSVRGASAIVDNARFVMTMKKMGKGEAEKFGISEEDRGYYVKLSFPKVNYTAPIPDMWLRRNLTYGGALEKIDLSPQKEERDERNSERKF